MKRINKVINELLRTFGVWVRIISMKGATVCMGLILGISFHALSQEVFLMQLSYTGDSLSIDSTATQLSSFNPYGKNITPSFVDSSTFLISANFPDKGQLDIWKLDLKKGTVEQMTHTKSDEYHPVTDKYHSGRILVIRRIDSVKNALWFYPVNKKDQGNSLFTGDRFKNFCTLDYNKYALIAHTGAMTANDTEGYKLLIYEQGGHQAFVVSSKVHPAIKEAGGKLYFIHHPFGSTRYLKQSTAGGLKGSILCDLPFKPGDFCPLGRAGFLASEDSRLYRYSGSHWKPLIDLKFLGIDKVVSLECHADKLLITATMIH